MRKLAVIFISLTSIILLVGVPGCAKSTSVPLTSQAETQTTVPSTTTASVPSSTPLLPSITSTSLQDGAVKSVYSQPLTAIGGSGTYTAWSITAGNLPVGLSLATSTGVISGTPTTAGTSNFIVRVSDSNGLTGSADLSITIAGTIISTTSFAVGVVGTTYSKTLVAFGGSSPYTWSITAGSLPVGLSLASATGVISGTPTTAGKYDFTLQVTDSSGVTATKDLSISAVVPTGITTTSLPNGKVNIAYSQTLVAFGGIGSYTWTVTSGTLPAGISLVANSGYLGVMTGFITGTPTAAGTSNFTVKVSDSSGLSATQALSITISS